MKGWLVKVKWGDVDKWSEWWKKMDLRWRRGRSVVGLKRRSGRSGERDGGVKGTGTGVENVGGELYLRPVEEWQEWRTRWRSERERHGDGGCWRVGLKDGGEVEGVAEKKWGLDGGLRKEERGVEQILR